jgi:hypothetical protein|nr:MAG TPA: tail connector protein [Caudoviricetes sp.]
MPNTPQVKFDIINRNVEQSSVTTGISTVLARTTKGPANDPSVLITSVPQFHRIYGKEVVPDGSISNIETALRGGSKLRIIRVVGPGAAPGKVKTASTDSLLKIVCNGQSVTLKAVTRSNGDPIGSGNEFVVTTKLDGNTVNYSVVGADGTVLDTGVILVYQNSDANNNTSVDYLSLSNFIANNPYLKIIVSPDNEPSKSLSSVEAVLNWLSKIDGSRNNVTVTLTATNTYTIGTSETSAPTSKEWIDALDNARDYLDSYHLGLSHAHQHLAQAELIKVYKAAKDLVDSLSEFQFYIEIPKYKVGTTDLMKAEDMINYKNQIASAIGHSKWISYYGAGLLYTNDYGILQPSDVLGTVLGLADSSGSTYSYSRSFAGLNRGVVIDANGPASVNYGSAGRLDTLNDLANACINLFVIKDTASYGKRTVLWHNFTDQVKKDSFRFLGNTGLILNIKKTLRPILDQYLEEPNHWSTWSRIYLEVQKYLTQWVDNNDLTDPKWQGDQDATSWDSLVVNNQTDVRQGKYKVVFSFKDVTALQEITITLSIDSSVKAIDVSLSNKPKGDK